MTSELWRGRGGLTKSNFVEIFLGDFEPWEVSWFDEHMDPAKCQISRCPKDAAYPQNKTLGVTRCVQD